MDDVDRITERAESMQFLDNQSEYPDEKTEKNGWILPGQIGIIRTPDGWISLKN